MDIKYIKKLIDLVNKSDLKELEVEEKGVRIRLRKEDKGDGGTETSFQAPKLSEAVPTPPKVVRHEKSVSPGKHLPEGDQYVRVESPMVGTFYRAPKEGDVPYVQEGDTVKKGQVLCIVEAMKLMNEIQSEVSGKIVTIITENSQPVEFGEPLFIIEKA